MANKQKHYRCAQCWTHVKKKRVHRCPKCKRIVCEVCRNYKGICFKCEPPVDDMPDGAYFAMMDELGGL